MIKSRRAIPSKPAPLYGIVLIVLLCLFLLFGWFWLQAEKNIRERGPSLISQRVSDVLNTSLSLSKATLSFPNHLLIENISIYDKEKTTTLLESSRLEIDFSLLSMLKGTIRPKRVTFISPKISTSTSQKNSLAGIIPTTMPQNQDSVSADSNTWTKRLKPIFWPIEINPNHLEFIEAQAHIENEQDSLPSIDGRFNLNITRTPHQKELALQSANIHLRDVHIFYRGIQGEVTGSVSIDKSNVLAHLTLHLPNSEEVTFKATIADYRRDAKVSFELKTNSYDLKNFAMIKYPLAQLPSTTNITGLITSTSPVLYGTPFDSLSASIILNQGNWRVDAVSLKLLEDKGELSGSISTVPGTENTSAKANLSYSGISLPDFKLSGNLLNTLGPILLLGPYSANTEISIDTSSYPLTATEIKMTSRHGDLFAKGIVDLFSGYTDMAGSFLKPASDNKGVEAIPLTISGPLNAPILSEPQVPSAINGSNQ